MEHKSKSVISFAILDISNEKHICNMYASPLTLKYPKVVEDVFHRHLLEAVKECVTLQEYLDMDDFEDEDDDEGK